MLLLVLLLLGMTLVKKVHGGHIWTRGRGWLQRAASQEVYGGVGACYLLSIADLCSQPPPCSPSPSARWSSSRARRQLATVPCLPA